MAAPTISAMRRQIDGVLAVSSAPVTRRVSGVDRMAFARGQRIRIRLDDASFDNGRMFLFAARDRPFPVEFASISSFTETVFKNPDRGVRPIAAAARPAPRGHLTFFRRAAGKRPGRYGFFALMRGAEARGPLPRVGRSRLPSRTWPTPGPRLDLDFPGATIDSSRSLRAQRPRARSEGAFLGLTGPMGPMPLHLTEFASYERRYAKSHPVRPVPRPAERPDAAVLLPRLVRKPAGRPWPAVPRTTSFAHYLGQLSGAVDGVREAIALPPKARLHYASLLLSLTQPRGAGGRPRPSAAYAGEGGGVRAALA